MCGRVRKGERKRDFRWNRMTFEFSSCIGVVSLNVEYKFISCNCLHVKSMTVSTNCKRFCKHNGFSKLCIRLCTVNSRLYQCEKALCTNMLDPTNCTKLSIDMTNSTTLSRLYVQIWQIQLIVQDSTMADSTNERRIYVQTWQVQPVIQVMVATIDRRLYIQHHIQTQQTQPTAQDFIYRLNQFDKTMYIHHRLNQLHTILYTERTELTSHTQLCMDMPDETILTRL